MSFPALFLACQAAEQLPPLDDEEFGMGWSDITAPPFEMPAGAVRLRGVRVGTGCVVRRDARLEWVH